MKIVINQCFGGFSISQEAAEHMAKNGSERAKKELEARPFYGYGYVDGMSSGYDRTDPLLVKAIEELGIKANGNHAKLHVVEIPDDIDYTIEEYDGKEWVAEKHQTWS